MTQLLPRRQICCLSSKTRRRNVGTQLSVFLMATEAPPLFKLHLYVLLYTSRHSHAVNFEVNSSRFIFWYRSKSPFQFSTFLLLKLLKVPSQQRSVSKSAGLRDFSWFFLIHPSQVTLCPQSPFQVSEMKLTRCPSPAAGAYPLCPHLVLKKPTYSTITYSNIKVNQALVPKESS